MSVVLNRSQIATGYPRLALKLEVPNWHLKTLVTLAPNHICQACDVSPPSSTFSGSHSHEEACSCCSDRSGRIPYSHPPRSEGDCSIAALRAPAQSSLPGPHCGATISALSRRLDSDLAAIYGVETKALNRAVTRNAKRFPGDFLFQLSREEVTNLRYQIGTSSSGYGGRRHLPHVFTETGAIMAANILNSAQAVRMSVFVVRAFVRMRELVVDHKALEKKLAELDARIGDHDEQLAAIIQAIHQLAAPDGPQHGRKIGFNQ